MKNILPPRSIIVLIAAGLLLPVLFVTVLSLTTPSIDPEQAAQRLRDPKEKAVLIDVRSPQEFAAFSLNAAKNLPLDMISNRAKTTEVVNGAETVFIICDTGFEGAKAVRALRDQGYRNVLNVAGGMDAWLTAHPAGIDITVRTPGGERPGVTPVSLPLLDQAAIVAAAFVLKPIYQIISIIIIVLLWKRRDADLLAIKWAMLAFLLGENACAANYLFFNERSLLMEFLHMYGMLLCFGLVVYALMEAVDKRALHYSDVKAKCTLLPQCGRCYKYNDMRCNLRSLFLLLIPAAMVLAAVPMTGSLGHRFFEGNVFSTPSLFGQPVAYQYLEARVFPAVSLLFTGAAFFVLLFRKEDGFEDAKRWLAIGMGPLGFSLMRFFLYWGYQDKPLWADTWEEITEFLFIAILLWITLKIKK